MFPGPHYKKDPCQPWDSLEALLADSQLADNIYSLIVVQNVFFFFLNKKDKLFS